MLKIVEEAWRILVTGPKPEVDFIRNRLSYEHPQKEVLKRRSSRLSDWDGKVKFFKNVGEDSFVNGYRHTSIRVKIGMKSRLKALIAEEELEYQWEGEKEWKPIPYKDDMLKGISFDDVQKECLAEMLKHRVCSIQLGTGSGKSEIFFAALVCYLSEFPDDKVLIVTSKKVLLRELEDRFKKRLPEYADKLGLLGDSRADLKQIVVSTPNSSRDNRKLIAYEEIAKWKEGCGLLILDESHHAKAKGWLEVIETCKPKCLWAVSGKLVYKTSDIKTTELEASFGPPVYVGYSKERTVPVIVKYHYHPNWRGKFDGEGLSSSLVDGVTVFHRENEDSEWKEGVWRGPDLDGLYPLFMHRSKCCGSRVDFDNDEYTCRFCGKVCISKVARDMCGIYADQNEEEKLDPQPDSEHCIYWMPYDMAVMEFSDFNLFYSDFAADLSFLKEKWVMSVRRSRQIAKFKKLFAKRHPKLKVGFVDGSLSGKKQLEVFKQLERGELDGIVSQYVISAEGLDVPSLLHIIKLDNYSSEQLLEQQKGRVERISPGKTCGYIHVPSMAQHWNLDKSFLKIKRYLTDLRELQSDKVTHKV